MKEEQTSNHPRLDRLGAAAKQGVITAMPVLAVATLLLPTEAYAASDGLTMAQNLVKLIAVALVVVGVALIVNAAYQLAEAHKEHRPSDGSEWWAIVQGGILVVIGTSTYLVDLFNLLNVL